MVVAPDNALLIDGKFEDIIRAGLVTFDHGKYAQRQPFGVVSGLGRLPRAGDLSRLIRVFLRCASRLTVDVHGIGLNHDIAAVIEWNGYHAEPEASRQRAITGMGV